MKSKPTRKPAPSAPADHQPLTREIRAAVADDGRNYNALAALAGIDQASLRRFMSRERSLSLDSADKLASVLGLHLIRRSRSKRTQGSGLRTELPTESSVLRPESYPGPDVLEYIGDSRASEPLATVEADGERDESEPVGTD